MKRIIILAAIFMTSCSQSETSNTNDEIIAGEGNITDYISEEIDIDNIQIWTKNIRDLNLFTGENHVSVVYAYDKNKTNFPDFFKDKLLDYSFTITEGLDGLSISKEGFLTYDVPKDIEHGMKKAYFRANNTKNDTYKDFDMDFYIMDTTVIIEGDVGPEGGTLENDKISVEFEDETFNVISNIRVLEGINMNGNSVSGMTSSEPMLKLGSTTYLN